MQIAQCAWPAFQLGIPVDPASPNGIVTLDP
jgi:hypothetical protein